MPSDQFCLLQSLPTKDGAKYLIDDNATHLTTEQFMQKYSESERGQEMLRQLQSEASSGSSLKYDAFKKRYTNGPWRSIKIVFRREFLLWRRDKYARVARLVQVNQSAGFQGCLNMCNCIYDFFLCPSART